MLQTLSFGQATKLGSQSAIRLPDRVKSAPLGGAQLGRTAFFLRFP